jgi:hypothetical protein
MGGRRFKPAVENYFMHRYGMRGGPFIAATPLQEKRNATSEAGETGASGNARSRMETPQDTLGRVLDAASGHRRPRVSNRKPTLVAAVKSTKCCSD